jgi:L-aminoadipate-semialdehyde dehydrogenase
MKRADKTGDLILVSYFVPNKCPELNALLGTSTTDGTSHGMDEMFRVYRKLVHELREYLRSKLPSYAVPTGLP